MAIGSHEDRPGGSFRGEIEAVRLSASGVGDDVDLQAVPPLLNALEGAVGGTAVGENDRDRARVVLGGE